MALPESTLGRGIRAAGRVARQHYPLALPIGALGVFIAGTVDIVRTELDLTAEVNRTIPAVATGEELVNANSQITIFREGITQEAAQIVLEGGDSITIAPPVREAFRLTNLEEQRHKRAVSRLEELEGNLKTVIAGRNRIEIDRIVTEAGAITAAISPFLLLLLRGLGQARRIAGRNRVTPANLSSE